VLVYILGALCYCDWLVLGGVLCFAGNTGTDLGTLVPMVPVTQVMAKPYWNIYWYVAPYEWCSLNFWFVLLAKWCYFPFLCGLAAEIVCAI
jgi:hypothetical protein